MFLMQKLCFTIFQRLDTLGLFTAWLAVFNQKESRFRLYKSKRLFRERVIAPPERVDKLALKNQRGPD